MLFCRLAGVFCSQFRSLLLCIVNFWCFIWYSVHFPPWHEEKTSLSKCQLYSLCCQDVRFALFFTFLGRGCVLCRPVCWCANWAQKCAVQTLHLSKKINMYPKSQFQLKKDFKTQNLWGCQLWTLIDFKMTRRFLVQFLLLASNIHFHSKSSVELHSDSDGMTVLLSLQEACQLGKITSVNVSHIYSVLCSFLHLLFYKLQ